MSTTSFAEAMAWISAVWSFWTNTKGQGCITTTQGFRNAHKQILDRPYIRVLIVRSFRTQPKIFPIQTCDFGLQVVQPGVVRLGVDSLRRLLPIYDNKAAR
jgi:hypothetical protein